MKVKAKRMKDSKHKDKKGGVIVAYCGPSSDQGLVEKMGRDIANKMNYTSPNGHMYYKTDLQTFKGISGSKYKITVPFNIKGSD